MCVGSPGPDGLLTFKFDISASDWDKGVYMGIVEKLVEALRLKDGKSILKCVSHSAITSHADNRNSANQQQRQYGRLSCAFTRADRYRAIQNLGFFIFIRKTPPIHHYLSPARGSDRECHFLGVSCYLKWFIVAPMQV